METARTTHSTAISTAGSPADAFERSAAEPFSALLETAAPPGRYSVLATRPWRVVAATGDRARIWTASGCRTRRGNPFDLLRDLLADAPAEGTAAPVALPAAVGYFGYDLGRFLERLPEGPAPDRPFPDLYLAFYDRLVVHDRADGRTRVVESRPRRPPVRATSVGIGGAPPAPAGMTSNFARSEYLRTIAAAKEHIAAGDIYELNLSQRFTAPAPEGAWPLYRRLRRASAAPYAAYLNLGDGAAVVSSSPELFVATEGRRIVTRPIKGTRPRGGSSDEDARLRDELERSPKDDAELAMIVDLERNDLGRVCGTGSVRVASAREIETHATVHHLVAAVEGTLKEGVGPVDVLRATFPGGSVTGCPKIRAMEIIDALEPTRRGVYTGAIGWIGAGGAMALSMGIRLATVHGARADFQVGGAIVADSDPEAEYEETLAKAAGMRAALGVGA